MQFTPNNPRLPHDHKIAVAFLRQLAALADPADEEAGALVRRIEADFLTLVIRKRRKELGVQL